MEQNNASVNNSIDWRLPEYSAFKFLAAIVLGANMWRCWCSDKVMGTLHSLSSFSWQMHFPPQTQTENLFSRKPLMSSEP